MEQFFFNLIFMFKKKKRNQREAFPNIYKLFKIAVTITKNSTIFEHSF